MPIAPPTATSTPRDPVKTPTAKDISRQQEFAKSKSSGRRATVAQIPGYLQPTKSASQKAVSSRGLYGSEYRSTTSGTSKASIRLSKPTFGNNSITYLAKPVKPGSTTSKVFKTSTGPITPTSPSPTSPFNRTSKTSTGPNLFKRQTSTEAKTSTGPISSSSRSVTQTRTSTGPLSPATNRTEPKTSRTSAGPTSPLRKTFTESRTSTGPITHTSKTTVQSKTSRPSLSRQSSTEATGPGSVHSKESSSARYSTGTSIEPGKSYLNPTSSSSRKAYTREKTTKTFVGPSSSTVERETFISKTRSEPAETTKTVSETVETRAPNFKKTRSIFESFEGKTARNTHPSRFRRDSDSAKKSNIYSSNVKVESEAKASGIGQDSNSVRKSLLESFEANTESETKPLNSREDIIVARESFLNLSKANNAVRSKGLSSDNENNNFPRSSVLESYEANANNDSIFARESLLDSLDAKNAARRSSQSETNYNFARSPTLESYEVNNNFAKSSVLDSYEAKANSDSIFAREFFLDSLDAKNAARNKGVRSGNENNNFARSSVSESSEPQTIHTLDPLADIIQRSTTSDVVNSFQFLDDSNSGAQEISTPEIKADVPVIVASSDENYSPDPKERNRLFSSRAKSSQDWVRSFPERSGNSEIRYSENFAPSPDIYEDRGYDYQYVTTETRKVRPKDQKILSYETTEKVPILVASSPEIDESFEKISIETPHIAGIPLPEISAHQFGSPPRKLIDSLSKSHFEFSASDAPLLTPPIERHRQGVVDKYLAGKTRGGTRTYKSSWAVGSGGAQTSSTGGVRGGGTLGSFERSAPEPILYEAKPRARSSYQVKSTTSTHSPFIGHSTSRTESRFSSPHQNHVTLSDPERFIASSVQRAARRDEHLQPLNVSYGEFSDEENTSPRSAQPSTQSDEEFIPIRVEVVKKKLSPTSQSGTKKVKKTVKTVTTTHSEPQTSSTNHSQLGKIREEVPDAYQGVFEIEDLNDEIEDLNGTVEYVDSREYRSSVPINKDMERTAWKKVSVPGGGYQIRESRSSGYRQSGRGSSPSRARQGRSPTRRADTMDGRHYGGGPSRAGQDMYYTHPPKDKKFLKKVQHELDEQRGQWKDEVERLTDSFALKNKITSRELQNNSGTDAGNNSFIDHSTGSPIFKAFVDVSDYPPRGIDVSVDSLENKVVVKASKRGADGVMRSFTQKVSLPRYSDADRISTKLSKEGILRVEVPLLFYFQPEKKKSKSFINQVVTNPDGSKYIEVLVNVGHDTHHWNLKILVNDNDELLIMYEKEQEQPNGQVKKIRKLIKKYILPKFAIASGIKSKLARDGRLVVTVPLAD